MKSKFAYYLINIIFLGLSIIMINYSEIFNISFNFSQLFTLIILLIIIHFIKFIRMYFIFLEEMIPIKNSIKLYVKTTFVSVILPFKVGELYKMYSYGYEVKDYVKGIIAVLIEKFFDAIILCILLVYYALISNTKITLFVWIMVIFVIIILILYYSFRGTYYYLNKFLITKVQNENSIYSLNLLEKLNDYYDKAKNLVKGRKIVLISLSALSWIVESILMYFIADYLNIKTQIVVIANYISDAFFGIKNILFYKYLYLVVAIFLIILILMYLEKIINIFFRKVKYWRNI